MVEKVNGNRIESFFPSPMPEKQETDLPKDLLVSEPKEQLPDDNLSAPLDKETTDYRPIPTLGILESLDNFDPDADVKDKVIRWLEENYPNLENQWELYGQADNETAQMERGRIINRMVYGLAEAMGVNIERVEYAPMADGVVGGCMIKSPILRFNEGILRGTIYKDSFKDVAEVVIHELRHEYQKEAVVHPEKFNVPDALRHKWKQNFRNYISYQENPFRYFIQPVEADAYLFSKAMLRLADLKGGL